MTTAHYKEFSAQPRRKLRKDESPNFPKANHIHASMLVTSSSAGFITQNSIIVEEPAPQQNQRSVLKRESIDIKKLKHSNSGTPMYEYFDNNEYSKPKLDPNYSPRSP